jgi:hypothetical protein
MQLVYLIAVIGVIIINNCKNISIYAGPLKLSEQNVHCIQPGPHTILQDHKRSYDWHENVNI